MLHCDQALELISARLDGELPAGDEARLEEHLQSCAACRALQADFEALHKAMLALEPVEPPAELLDNVLNQIHQAKAVPMPRRRIRWRAMGSVAAVLVVALLGAGAIRLGLLHTATDGSTGAAAPAGAGMDNNGVAPQSAESEAGSGDGAESTEAFTETMQLNPEKDTSCNDDAAGRTSDGTGRFINGASEEPEGMSSPLPMPASEKVGANAGGTQSTEAYCGRLTLPYSSAPALEAAAVWYEGNTICYLLPAGDFEALAEEIALLPGCVLEAEGDGISPKAEWGLVMLTGAPAEGE